MWFQKFYSVLRPLWATFWLLRKRNSAGVAFSNTQNAIKDSGLPVGPMFLDFLQQQDESLFYMPMPLSLVYHTPLVWFWKCFDDYPIFPKYTTLMGKKTYGPKSKTEFFFTKYLVQTFFYVTKCLELRNQVHQLPWDHLHKSCENATPAPNGLNWTKISRFRGIMLLNMARSYHCVIGQYWHTR